MVAALYVETDGAYFGLPGVDPWDAVRDARGYTGPWPIVAHPPCARWGRLAALVESKGGAKRHEDGGLFAHALAMLRAWGGVMEHPAFTDAWDFHGIQAPPQHGQGWGLDTRSGIWSCSVDQAVYGHRSQKRTWLAYFSPLGLPPFDLDWRTQKTNVKVDTRLRSAARQQTGMQLLKKSERNCTPFDFRDVLLRLALTHPPIP